MTSLHAKSYPNETPEYRAARDALLLEERELRRQIERVAAQRRSLPQGGEVPENYLFEDEDGPVRLSELFGDKTTLITYSYMFGPGRERPCPSCTSMLSGLDGQVPDIVQRVALVVVAKSPVARLRAFADERGWRHLRLVSSAGNSFNRDYHAERPNGAEVPLFNVFERRDGVIRHFHGGELVEIPEDPGQNFRGVDLIWPLWNLLDLTPEGRGADWHPSLDYD